MRLALLRSAATQFARRGYAGVSVRGVLDEAGVTAPALYHHFGSKAGLYTAVVETTASVVLTTVQAAADDHEDPAEQVCAVLDALLALHAQHPRALLLFDVVERDIQLHPEIDRLREVLAQLADFWSTLGAQDTAASGRPLAVRSVVEGFVRAAQHVEDHQAYADVAVELQRIVRGGLDVHDQS